MAESSGMRIVILGNTGSGKSSLANTIFGHRDFKICHTLNSETKECRAETRSVNGRSITLVDTPGFFDTDISEEEMKPEIVRCITECAPGPHAFLIVLKVDIFTDQEQVGMNKIQEYFSDEAFKYATVVFTHGDQLPDGKKIEDFADQNKLVSDLVKKCGGRCHVIDNKYWEDKPMNEYRSNQFQVKELLKAIEKMVMEKNGGYYTNEMLQAVEEKIQQQEERIRQEEENMRQSSRLSVLFRRTIPHFDRVRAAFVTFAPFDKTDGENTPLTDEGMTAEDENSGAQPDEHNDVLPVPSLKQS